MATLRSARAAGLDLAAAGGDREVGNEGVLGFAGAVRHDDGVVRACPVGGWRPALQVACDPGWSLMSTAVAKPHRCRAGSISTLVTNRSSPTSGHVQARRCVSWTQRRASRVRTCRPRSSQSDGGRRARRDKCSRPARRCRAARASASLSARGLETAVVVHAVLEKFRSRAVQRERAAPPGRRVRACSPRSRCAENGRWRPPRCEGGRKPPSILGS